MAILEAILNFSKCSRLATCYLPDIHCAGAKEPESKEKKTLSADTWLHKNWHLAEIVINFWCKMILYVIFDVVVDTQSQKDSQKWISDAQISKKNGIT